MPEPTQTAAAPGTSRRAAAYRRNGYAVLPEMVSPDLRATIRAYLGLPSTRARLTPCDQVPGSLRIYGDPMLDALLASLAGPVGDALGLRLAPTYTYVREYRAGNELSAHVDRPECEHSVTLFLGEGSLEDDHRTSWPIELEDRRGTHRAVETPPGTLLAYQGTVLRHWRGPCPVDRQIQAFLHYVDLDGPFADRANDGRSALGQPAGGGPAPERIQIEAFGARVVVDDETAELADRLRQRLPSTVSVQLASTGRGRLVGRYRVASSGGRFELRKQTEVVTADRDLDEVVDDVLARAERKLSLGAPRHAYLHAGVVGWHGVGIVVPGASGAGKSTLVEELVRLGATYYSDEYAVIDGRGRVHAYPRPLPPGTAPEVLAAAGAADAEPRPSLPVAVVAAVAYQPSTTTWSPSIVSGAMAGLALLDHVLAASTEPARALAVARQLCQKATVLEGTRPDVEVAGPALLDLAAELAGELGRPRRRTAVRSSARSGRGAARPRGSVQASGTALRAAPYLRFEDVLTTRQRNRLLRAVRSRWAEAQPSQVVEDARGVESPDYRRSRTMMGALAETGPLRRTVASLVPLARAELGLPWFALAPIEVQCHGHRHGDFFRAHHDVGPDPEPRRLTCVYYFSDQPFGGGALHLYDEWRREEHGPVASTALASSTVVEAVDNSLVIFRSETLHEVQPILSLGEPDGDPLRYSVTLWVRERPGHGAAQRFVRTHSGGRQVRRRDEAGR